MTKYEKLILLMVALLLIGKVGAISVDIYIAHTYGANIPPGDVVVYAKNIRLFLATLVSIGCAIWLFSEAKSQKLKAWVWALFGLVFSLMAIVIFYLVQIYSKNVKTET